MPMLIMHIAIALTSVVFTTYLYLSPSRTKIHTAYGLVAATLGTGTYLVVSMQSSLLHSCLAGLGYLAVVATGIALSARKLSLAAEHTR
jgi:hypothetical protein